jgi:hypothetical protein
MRQIKYKLYHLYAGATKVNKQNANNYAMPTADQHKPPVIVNERRKANAQMFVGCVPPVNAPDQVQAAPSRHPCMS